MRPDSHEIYGRRQEPQPRPRAGARRLRAADVRGHRRQAPRGGGACAASTIPTRRCRGRGRGRWPARRSNRRIALGPRRGRRADGRRELRRGAALRPGSAGSPATAAPPSVAAGAGRGGRPTAGSRSPSTPTPRRAWPGSSVRSSGRCGCGSARPGSPSTRPTIRPTAPLAGQAGFNVVPFAAGRLLRQDRLLLLRAAGARARRADRHAGELLRRSGDARRPRGARRDRDHALLYHVSGRPARGGPCRAGGERRESRRRRPIARSSEQ